MTYHVVRPTEYSGTSFNFTIDLCCVKVSLHAGSTHIHAMIRTIVFGLMPIAILSAREATLRGLRAALMAAEETLGVAFVMLAEITATSKS